jgi:hypothetical protein
MSLEKALSIAIDTKKRKNWDYIYIAVDIHSTVLKPNYDSSNIPTEFYPHAKEVLGLLGGIDSVKLIMWTSSTPEDIREYKKLFVKEGIFFDYVNENPEVKSEGFGYFEDKFYFNLLLEDKAGFDANGLSNDWIKLYKSIDRLLISDDVSCMDNLSKYTRLNLNKTVNSLYI